MRPVTLLKGEGSSQVLTKQGGLFNFTEETSIDGFLISNSAIVDLALGRLGITKQLLLADLGLGASVAGEVSSIELAHVDAANIDLGASTDDIGGINTTERNTVKFEGTSNKESVVLKNLKENDTLASETAGKKDQNSAGNQRFSGLVCFRDFVGLSGNRSGLSLVPLRFQNGHCSRMEMEMELI